MQVHLLLVSTVILYKFYHRMGAIFLMKDLSDPIEKADVRALAACPAGELCSYRFFHGILFVRPYDSLLLSFANTLAAEFPAQHPSLRTIRCVTVKSPAALVWPQALV